MGAVPTSAWHRDKLRWEDITFTEDQQEHGNRGQGQGEGGRHQDPHGEGEETPSAAQTGADQPVRNYSLLYIHLILFFSNFQLVPDKVC